MLQRRTFDSTTAEFVLPWGEILYRAGMMFAAIVIVFATINILYQASIGEFMVPIAPFIVAAAIWLLGLFCRFVSR
jgi:hypothetical protein